MPMTRTSTLLEAISKLSRAARSNNAVSIDFEALSIEDNSHVGTHGGEV